VGRGRGYPRGGRVPQVHRNRTLVLNGGGTSTPPSDTMSATQANMSLAPISISQQTPPAWVTKTDRHLQLINPAIYERQSQQRAKAIEETRKLKLRQRDERERVKLSRHLQRLSTMNGQSGPSSSTVVAPNYEISVQGIRFRVVKNGSKLMKVSGKIFARTSTLPDFPWLWNLTHMM
jgi:hypothetical protein